MVSQLIEVWRAETRGGVPARQRSETFGAVDIEADGEEAVAARVTNEDVLHHLLGGGRNAASEVTTRVAGDYGSWGRRRACGGTSLWRRWTV